jgi:predicted HicB family RNase H-like nuclease
MNRKVRRKKGAAMVKRILVALPEDLHTAMKTQAAAQRTTVKEYVTEAIRQAVTKGERRGKQ